MELQLVQQRVRGVAGAGPGRADRGRDATPLSGAGHGRLLEHGLPPALRLQCGARRAVQRGVSDQSHQHGRGETAAGVGWAM